MVSGLCSDADLGKGVGPGAATQLSPGSLSTFWEPLCTLHWPPGQRELEETEYKGASRERRWWSLKPAPSGDLTWFPAAPPRPQPRTQRLRPGSGLCCLAPSGSHLPALTLARCSAGGRLLPEQFLLQDRTVSDCNRGCSRNTC